MALSASDIQTVFSLLSNALSPDISVRKPAESALAECEGRPGFCSCLFEIIAAKDLSSQVDVRLLASVYFKNNVSRYWRYRRNAICITNDEKAHLRNKLVVNIREENAQVALQLAVLISKIARFDYPKEWPELFSLLAQQIQSTDTVTCHRAFLVLYQSLKELSTKRLLADQKVFSEVATQLFHFCWNCWHNDAQNILQSFTALSQSLSTNPLIAQFDDFYLICERWLMCSKIIRLLIVFGYPSDATTQEDVRFVKETCPVMFDVVQSLLPFYTSLMEKSSKISGFVKQSSTKLMKVLVSVQARHPYSFSDEAILLPVIDFCWNKITNPDPAILSFEELLIQCMILIKATIECRDYKPSATGHVIKHNELTREQRRKNILTTISEKLTAFFSRERVILLCNVLVRRYIILTSNDFDDWNQNPETFHHEQDMIQWTERLRPCAEALYIVLFENYRELLGPVVVSILREATSACAASESEISDRMLLKDAAYTAAGHVYYELSNYLNFDEWFKSTLAPELSNNHTNMRIIHRKIALVLGQWVSEIKGDTRKLVYCSLVGLLQHQDIAVRLASCRSLYFHIQDSNFFGDDFHELLPTCWSSCFKLFEDVHEFDSKVQVLNFISILIEHAADKMLPLSKQLVSFFQKVWEDSNGESLLQIQLLAALRNFVCSLGSQSAICYGMLLPILQRGIDTNNPDKLNLLEDSVLLWEATLSHATSIVPQLLEFFPYLMPIMENSFDHLQAAVNIIEAYIVLGGTEFLNKYAPVLVKLLDGIVGNVNDKGLLSTLPIIEILVQLYPTEVPPLIGGLLQKLVVICLSKDDHNISREAVRAASGVILARLLVMNTNFLAQLTSEPSLSIALQQAGLLLNQNILLCLVDVWLDKADQVSFLQKKTYALALSVILTLRVPEVLDKLDEILSVCTSVILGGTEGSSEEASGDATSCADANNEGSGSQGLPSRDLQKRQIRASDLIKHLSLEDVLRENLQAFAAFHGEASFNSAISSIHPTALAQLKQALKMA